MNRPKPCLRLIKGDSESPDEAHAVLDSQAPKAGENEQKAKTARKPLIRFLNSFCDAIDQEIAQILNL